MSLTFRRRPEVSGTSFPRASQTKPSLLSLASAFRQRQTNFAWQPRPQSRYKKTLFPYQDNAPFQQIRQAFVNFLRKVRHGRTQFVTFFGQFFLFFLICGAETGVHKRTLNFLTVNRISRQGQFPNKILITSTDATFEFGSRKIRRYQFQGSYLHQFSKFFW